MKKTWLPSALMTKFWAKPGGTEASVPVQSALMEYVAVISGMTVGTLLMTTVPLPVTPPIPSATIRFSLCNGQAVEESRLSGHIGTAQGGGRALVGWVGQGRRRKRNGGEPERYENETASQRRRGYWICIYLHIIWA